MMIPEESYIIFFKTKLETLNLFSRKLEKRFKERGFMTYVLNCHDAINGLNELYKLLATGKVKALIGFNIAIYDMKLESGANLWEALNIPCINILVDHPYWYPDILNTMPKNGVVLCIDRNHMNYVSRFYPSIGTTGFIAHGGSIPDHPSSSKNIDVLYCGSIYSQEIANLTPDFSFADFPAQKICDDTISFLIAHPEHTIESVLMKQFEKNGLVAPDDSFSRFVSYTTYIERTVSSHYREMLVRTLAENGLSITIYGNGWDSYEFINLPNVDYRGFISPEEVLDTISQSYVTLNSMPWFKDGSHERIFNAMLSDSLVVTENNPYLQEVLPDDCFVEYSLSKESMINAANRIKDLLQNKAELKTITDKAKKIALSSHMWENRADELIEFLMSEYQ